MYPKMFSTDFIFRQQENLVDNQKCQAGFRPLFNKILFQTERDAVNNKCEDYARITSTIVQKKDSYFMCMQSIQAFQTE